MIGLAVGLVAMRLLGRPNQAEAAKEAEALRAKAENEAEKIRLRAESESEEELRRLRKEQDEIFTTERNELRDWNRKLQEQEQEFDDKSAAFEKRRRALKDVEDQVAKRQGEVREKEQELERVLAEQERILTETAGMSHEQAREAMLLRVRNDIAADEERLIARSEEVVRSTSESKARDILATAIQRYAADHTADINVSTVDLPNDDLKGRIIGREGRNIRAFEKATGVDVIVDDTPGVVLLSAFDGVRRETARRAMSKLVKDGRVHPARIEEIARQTRSEMEEDINETGKKAVLDLNIGNLHPKLVHLLGRLQYRTSYGQNVLKHSMEAAFLCGNLAAELGLDPVLAKRCGLLHDIGKAVDHEVDGGHPAIGADIARRCNEDKIVVNAIAAHHNDVRMETAYAVLTAAADAVSAARPGARRDTLERYIQRLVKLEEIASRFEGVDQAFAIQAGREVRVMVNPNRIGDRTAQRLAREIARSIEEELTYPGEVKVTLLRELRVTDYAR
jgi:ribonuclease Y